MKPDLSLPILSDFFLDGAKIIFGSLVVGAFVPSVSMPQFSSVTFVFGLTMTVMCIAAATVFANYRNS